MFLHRWWYRAAMNEEAEEHDRIVEELDSDARAEPPMGEELGRVRIEPSSSNNTLRPTKIPLPFYEEQLPPPMSLVSQPHRQR
jgi:hypothetical protein